MTNKQIQNLVIRLALTAICLKFPYLLLIPALWFIWFAKNGQGAGALVRLVAPLLQHKLHDPAVLLLAAEGPTLLPLLGGHSQQADSLAEQLAPLLQASVIQSGFSSSQGLPALDAFGEAWG